MMKNNEKTPSNLSKSHILIIVKDFDTWIKTHDKFPKGYDNYAQKETFKNYNEEIISFENFLKERDVKYSKITYLEFINGNKTYEGYILDNSTECEGGDKENDWWTCLHGFYIQNIQSGVKYDIKAAIKQIKRETRKRK